MKDKKSASTMNGQEDHHVATDTMVQTSTDDIVPHPRGDIDNAGEATSFTSAAALKSVSRAENKPKSKRDVFTLSPTDHRLLNELKLRCESTGVKIKKTQLLVTGLHLLSSLPMGKLLAVIGPLESKVIKPQIRKKKMRPPG